MHLNTSHDTSEFCCDSIAHWWKLHGCQHYPPYCSKHNPIEHRLFLHITHACHGVVCVVFHSVAIAKHFMEKAKTFTGLKVTFDIVSGVYTQGKKCAKDFVDNMRIIYDD